MLGVEKLTAPIRRLAEGIGGLVRDLVSREIDRGVAEAIESRRDAMETLVVQCRQRLLGEPESIATEAEPPKSNGRRRLARA
jgi:hypothetical protein